MNKFAEVKHAFECPSMVMEGLGAFKQTIYNFEIERYEDGHCAVCVHCGARSEKLSVEELMECANETHAVYSLPELEPD